MAIELDRDKAIAWLRENVSEHRLQHIFGVETMAAELAEIHGVDTKKAAIAGLLHDLAKFFPPKKLLTMAHQESLNVDKICAAVTHLIHADVSAIVAEAEFGITDPEILEAIALHTLGKAEMDDLSCIVFLADALEPGRGDSKSLQKLRKHSRKNLHKAVWKVCDCTLDYLMQQKKVIHPRMISTRNWALKRCCS